MDFYFFRPANELRFYLCAETKNALLCHELKSSNKFISKVTYFPLKGFSTMQIHKKPAIKMLRGAREGRGLKRNEFH